MNTAPTKGKTMNRYDRTRTNEARRETYRRKIERRNRTLETRFADRQMSRLIAAGTLR